MSEDKDKDLMSEDKDKDLMSEDKDKDLMSEDNNNDLMSEDKDKDLMSEDKDSIPKSELIANDRSGDVTELFAAYSSPSSTVQHFQASFAGVVVS